MSGHARLGGGELPQLYCDGGVVGMNPSTLGGTYAYVVVGPGGEAAPDWGGEDPAPGAVCSGVVVPTLGALQYTSEVAGRDLTSDWRAEYIDLEVVTNNVSELVALVRGLESLPDGWTGTVFSDSQVTLGRAFRDWAMSGVPLTLQSRLARARARLGPLGYTLLAGHPTRAELAQGFSDKRGLPVSAHNALCDKLCQARAVDMIRHFDLERLHRETFNRQHAGKHDAPGGREAVTA